MTIKPINRAWVIYTLSDPRCGSVRYVGWTVNPRQRLRDHTKPSKLAGSQRRDKWINSLPNKLPIMKIIEEGFGAAYAEAEMRWIKHYREAGCDLTNHTDGGDGTIGRLHTSEAKARMSAKRQGTRPSQKAIEAARAVNKGAKQSPALIAARVAKIRGVPKTEEHKRKLSAAKTGRKMSEAAKQNMRNAAALIDPEVRKKRSHHASSHSVRTAEGNRRISEAKKAFWARLTPEERSTINRKRWQCRAEKNKSEETDLFQWQEAT